MTLTGLWRLKFAVLHKVALILRRGSLDAFLAGDNP
jgi:hypothetical protein